MLNHPLTTQPVHLSYRLRGSIPGIKLERLGQDYRTAKLSLNRHFTLRERHKDSLRYPEYERQLAVIRREYFLRHDRLLDQVKTGPRFLESAAAKKIVLDSWAFLARDVNLVIYAISVMSNHVHVLLRAAEEDACIPLRPLLYRHKHFTGLELNKLHKCFGRRVWHDKVFDGDVRPGKFSQVLWYILNNPRKAGITDDVLNWCGNWWHPQLWETHIHPRLLEMGLTQDCVRTDSLTE
ncbi:MAG: hypothetical protein AAFN92_14210 [Bacteroidota bacterium]